ncbi:TlpA family protein disulfide reductase [Autumnicola psychrophila]|uniref:Redoxin domain-containing protein n=1 Tax=Autumnicola psychrophila TaxID=3075592 RepID=A0ABU3DSM6_9FLAO|nr:redoxin domain-containing protein [Zunongwangia sp. F225]MDT0686718.1 redoxin domain-containing protein [Zunongwangia sp. F225]
MRKFLLILLLLTGLKSHPQSENNDKVYFSEALSMHLPKYEQKAKVAYRFDDYNRGRFLFDSLVRNCLKNSYMDNFRFYTLRKKPIQLYDFKKPVYLITYASWCIRGKGEIPAINKLASKYKDQIDFVILFWDKPEMVKGLAKEFDKNINVVYVDERKNSDPFVIKNLKHSLGLPTCFLISESKKIKDIRRSIYLPYNATAEESFDLNYEFIEEGISSHLINNQNQEVAEIF